jgi:hypothetical protein
MWLKVILGVVGVVFLGPPVLALLLAAVGLTFSVTAGALKLALIGLVIYGLVMLTQAVFGKSASPGGQVRKDSMLESTEYVDRMDAERRALDAELARAVAATQK